MPRFLAKAPALLYEVEHFAFVEDDGDNLKVCLRVDIEEIQHDLRLRDGINQLEDVVAPQSLGNVARRELFTV